MYKSSELITLELKNLSNLRSRSHLPQKYFTIPALLIVAFAAAQLAAQTSYGHHPHGLNWQIMRSPAANVIFPQGMERQATRICRIIDHINRNNRRSVGEKSVLINIVLQNQTVVPNGYVGLAPLVSEFYATPLENTSLLGSMKWLDALAIHEYRHVQQLINTRKRITKLFYLLGGEIGWLLGSYLTVPNWYFEGDAVITETALTSAGRGRTPSFTAQQRALSLAGIDYSYMKARNGSFKDVVPDHYSLGYLMLTHLRNEKGNDVIKNVVTDAEGPLFFFYPFSRALKRHTNYRPHTLYEAGWQAARNHWDEKAANVAITPSTRIAAANEGSPTNHYFPQFDGEGGIVVLRNSFQETDAVYRIANGRREKIVSIGVNLGAYFHYADHKILWTEYSQHPRRVNVTYSDIYSYDVKTGKKKKITHKGKYFSPVLSADSHSIFAIHISEIQRCEIHRLDIATGVIQAKTAFADDEFVSRLSVTDGDAVVYNLKRDQKLGLYLYDFRSRETRKLTPRTAHVIDAPRVAGDHVYYSASFSGLDNIYRSPLDGSLSVDQMTSVPVGAYEPAVNPDNTRLIFTEVTVDGRAVASMDISSTQPLGRISLAEPVDMDWFDEVAHVAEGGNILGEVTTGRHYPVEPYRGLFKDMKLHSWSIPSSVSVPSINLQARNYLNDVGVTVGGGFNRNEERSFYNTQLIVGRWYPVVTLTASRNKRSTTYLNESNDPETATFDQTAFGIHMTLPHQWVRGNYFTNLNVTTGISHRKIANSTLADGKAPKKNLNALLIQADFSSLRRTALQNIGPQLGLSSKVVYRRDWSRRGNEKVFTTHSLYMPGLTINHQTKLRFAYQKKLLSQSFQYEDAFEYARGYDAPINDRTWQFSIDYGLPLVYPDWGFAGLTYFMRVRANIFYDNNHSSFESLGRTKDLQSIGLEIISDNTVFNLLPLSFGIRVSYRLQEDPHNQGKSLRPSFFVGTDL